VSQLSPRPREDGEGQARNEHPPNGVRRFTGRERSERPAFFTMFFAPSGGEQSEPPEAQKK
jgi:hypothetical protein